MDILFPINIDRWTNPIATLLREIALHNPALHFSAFSKPASPEDRQQGQAFWAQPHIHRRSHPALFLRSFAVVHHASATRANLAAALACRLRSGGRCRHIYTANVQPHRQDGSYRYYDQAIRQAHTVVAVSQAVADDIAATWGRRVAAVIPNGVDLAFFDPAAARPPDYAAFGFAAPYVLSVARLVPRKRPDVVLHLAAHLPAVRFVVVGSAPDTPAASELVRQMQQQPNISYLGPQPRQTVRDLLAHAAALVFPSELEGLPLTVVEALAMGLPVLAQPKSSLPELVRPQQTGWLLPADTPADLVAWADRLHRLLAWSSDERQAHAHRARAFVSERYTWQQVARQYYELYTRQRQ